jgi:hypothetical protein
MNLKPHVIWFGREAALEQETLIQLFPALQSDCVPNVHLEGCGLKGRCIFPQRQGYKWQLGPQASSQKAM